MCGILGQVNRNFPPDKTIFQIMLDTLAKRGPDNEGLFFERNLALGHRRLSILDVSSSGNQPMSSEDENLVIVFNGEIYNYQELKKELSGNYSFFSHSDTEVILKGYAHWGMEVVQKLEGMFSLAIYDKKKEILTLARDRFGEKPLYYYLDSETFCFASELKAILKNPSIKAKLKIDESSLIKYLFYGYIPSPNTIFSPVKKMTSATVFQFSLRDWKIMGEHEYWNPEKILVRKERKENEILKELDSRLEKSVERRLSSDVPLGIFLSGGLDSSLVAVYASRFYSDLESFSVAYDNQEIDESPFAAQVAKKLGIRHNFCHFTKNLVEENFLEMINYLDEPLADAAVIPLYFLSKFSKSKISVALSGDGGDELFGGYPKYQANNLAEKYQLLSILANGGKNFFPSDSAYYKFLAGFNLPFPVRQFIWGSGGFLVSEAENLLKHSSFNLNNIFAEAWKIDKSYPIKDNVNRGLFLDARIQLPDGYLTKTDRATMAASLEARSPFLDKGLAEWSWSLEGSWKIKGRENKYILKKLAEKYLDKAIIYRPKRGFGVPLDHWIRNELKDLFSQYLFLDLGFFQKDYIEKIYREHLAGQADHQFKLLRIFIFNYFYKKYV